MKRAIAVCFCLIMALGLVACGTPPAANPQQSASVTAQESTAQPVTLDFWDMAWGPAATYPVEAQRLVEQYTQSVAPNVSINYTNLPWSNWFEQYSTAVASGSAPDVCSGGGYMPFQFAANNEMADLQWIVNEWKKEGTDDDFLQGMLDYWRYKDKQVAIPYNYSPRVGYIRVDWLKDKGLSMPKNYDELISVAKAFTDQEKGVYGMAFGVGTNSAGPFTNLATGNGGFCYNQDGSANVDNERNLQVMRLFNTLKKEGCLPEGIENYTGDDADKLFIAGKCGIVIKDVGSFNNFLQGGMTTGQVGVMPPPQSPSGSDKYQLCTNGYMMFEQGQNKTEAMQFLKWFSENNLTLFTVGGQSSFPARISFLSDNEFKKENRSQIIQYVLSNNCVPMTTPMVSGVPSASYVEGQKFDMIILQSALTMDENGWKETLQKLQKDLTENIATLDK